MKQLIIVNSAKALKSGVADDLTALDAGQIGFFNLDPDASGGNEGKVTFLSTKPTKNFGIALGKGASYPAFVLPEVDLNTLNVSIAQPAAGAKFNAEITIPSPAEGDYYTLVVTKKGTVPGERYQYSASDMRRPGKSLSAANMAKSLADQLQAMADSGTLDITVTLNGAKITVEGNKIGEQFGLTAGDDLFGTSITVNSEAKDNIGDTAYIQKLAQQCAADKGFVYLDQASKDIYPGYPEQVEQIAQADIATKGYVLFNLRFATKRDSGKTFDEAVWQYVHIAVPKNNASLSTITSILEQPVLPNTPAEVQAMINETLTEGNYMQQGTDDNAYLTKGEMATAGYLVQGEGDDAFKTKGENDALYAPLGG